MKNKIIQILRTQQDYISGEGLSKDLKISRAAIWKNIQELRKDGYEIVATPHLGYKLEGVPDKLYPRELKESLSTEVIGKNIHYFDSLPSTMDEAYKRARAGEPEGTVVLAEGQSKGRGRMGREWSSPRGKGIYFSVILRPHLKPVDVAKMTLMAAVSLCEAVNETAGIQACIKWPNDLLFEGKKLAGILTEMNAEMDRVHFCILGIGLNISTRSTQMPETATTLKKITGKSINRVRLTQNIFRKLDQWYAELQAFHFEEILQRWRELSLTLGQEVRIGDVEGKAVDIDEYGALMIQQSNGKVVKQLSGDLLYV